MGVKNRKFSVDLSTIPTLILGFPLTIGLGFVIIYITLPAVGNHLVNFSDQMLQMTRMLVVNNG